MHIVIFSRLSRRKEDFVAFIRPPTVSEDDCLREFLPWAKGHDDSRASWTCAGTTQGDEKRKPPDGSFYDYFLDPKYCHSSIIPDLLHLLFEETLHLNLLWQLDLVLGNEESVIHSRQGVLHKSMFLLSTEENANRKIVSIAHHVLVIPAYVCVELSEMLVVATRQLSAR